MAGVITACRAAAKILADNPEIRFKPSPTQIYAALSNRALEIDKKTGEITADSLEALAERLKTLSRAEIADLFVAKRAGWPA